MSRILGIWFLSLAWLMGIPWQECRVSGQLLGVKMVATELWLISSWGATLKQSTPEVPGRTAVILTVCLVRLFKFCLDRHPGRPDRASRASVAAI
ncbi:MAG UNVERIFIED_CONTAM: hypothetical protein LVR18_49370 [Planctomycetaceae bacterium]|jgi:CNT family concentrative nucleoside transporter